MERARIDWMTNTPRYDALRMVNELGMARSCPGRLYFIVAVPTTLPGRAASRHSHSVIYCGSGGDSQCDLRALSLLDGVFVVVIIVRLLYRLLVSVSWSCWSWRTTPMNWKTCILYCTDLMCDFFKNRWRLTKNCSQELILITCPFELILVNFVMTQIVVQRTKNTFTFHFQNVTITNTKDQDHIWSLCHMVRKVRHCWLVLEN